MGGTKSSSTSRLALLDLKYSEVTVCGPRWCSPPAADSARPRQPLRALFCERVRVVLYRLVQPTRIQWHTSGQIIF